MYREICLSVALALATAVGYLGVLSNGFVNLDDDLYVYANAAVQRGLSRPSVNWAFTTTYLGNWHPLTWLSLELDYQCFGLRPAGYHATNLFFHVASTVVLFWLLRTITGALGRSACAAAFFALHPLHVESVAWISERKDVLGTFFFLLSMLLWQFYARRSRMWGYALAVALFVLSLMSKAMGITLPLVLLLLDYWPLGRWPRKAAAPSREARDRPSTATVLVAEKLPFFLLSAAFAAITVLVQGKSGALDYGRSLSFGDRLLLAPVNYVTYLRQTFWPVDLAVLYPHPGGDLAWWRPLVATLGLLLVTAACWRLRKSFAYLLVGWLWFLVTLLPVIGLVQVGRQATADRYMYLPMIGLLVMLCWGVYDLAGARRWAKWTVALAATACLLVCAELTARQVALWRDNLTLWRHALDVTSPTTTSCVNYGRALLDERGEEEEAERWYKKALELDPRNFAANFSLGVLMGHKGRHQEAAQYLEAALEVKPNDPLVLENLALAEELQGQLDTALEHYELAGKLDPLSPSIRERLKRVRQKQAK